MSDTYYSDNNINTFIPKYNDNTFYSIGTDSSVLVGKDIYYSKKDTSILVPKLDNFIYYSSGSDLFVDKYSFNSSLDRPILIGNTADLSSGFIGSIDDVRLYGTILSQSDVNELYNSRMTLDNKGNMYINKLSITGSSFNINSSGNIKCTDLSEVGPVSGMIGYWPLNGDTKDYSGNANNGTLVNTPTVVQGLKEKRAYNFVSTSSQAISVPYSSILTPTYISISFFAYSSNWSADALEHGMVSKTEAGGYSLTQSTASGGSISFYVYRSGVGYTDASYSKSFLSVGWHHFVGTFDGRYTKLYVDSVLVKTTDSVTTVGLGYTYNNPLTIGAEPSQTDVFGDYFNGRIQEVRIYNRAITNSEISQLYNIYNYNSTTKMKIIDNGILINSLKETT